MAKKILCVCRGNTCRSPMLEILLQTYLDRMDKDIRVESAGILKQFAEKGHPANENSVICMAEKGLDLGKHKSRWTGNLNLKEYSLFLCMGKEEEEWLQSNGVPYDKIKIVNAENDGIPNPYKMGLKRYRQCALMFNKAIPKIAKKL